MDRLQGMSPTFGIRHSRWRAWLRVHTPNAIYYRLGLTVPKLRECGAHEWYNADNVVDHCYHCRAERVHGSDRR
jgi:hypothetical protein